MRSGQFCSGGTTLADCWLSKEDQRDSLGGKSPEKCCVFLELFGRGWHLGLKRQRRTRTTGRRWRRSSLKRMYKAYMASLGKTFFGDESLFFSLDNQTLWRECRRPDQRRPQWTWWKVGGWFEIKKRDQDLDLMKSSGMAGRTVMTTRESRRYLHS